jgi:hypothetical protein
MYVLCYDVILVYMYFNFLWETLDLDWGMMLSPVGCLNATLPRDFDRVHCQFIMFLQLIISHINKAGSVGNLASKIPFQLSYTPVYFQFFGGGALPPRRFLF